MNIAMQIALSIPSSNQAVQIAARAALPGPNDRVTEDDEARITEDGEQRTTE